MAVFGAVAGDGHRAVDGHLMLFTVLCDVERVWRKLKRKKKVKKRQIFINCCTTEWHNDSQILFILLFTIYTFLLELIHNTGMFTFSPA